METIYEYIRVLVRYEGGKTVCICRRGNKPPGCGRTTGCSPEVVLRDKYRGWRRCLNVNKYGKTEWREENDDERG